MMRVYLLSRSCMDHPKRNHRGAEESWVVQAVQVGRSLTQNHWVGDRYSRPTMTIHMCTNKTLATSFDDQGHKRAIAG